MLYWINIFTIFKILASTNTKNNKDSNEWEKPQIKIMSLGTSQGGGQMSYYERLGKTNYYGGS